MSQNMFIIARTGLEEGEPQHGVVHIKADDEAQAKAIAISLFGPDGFLSVHHRVELAEKRQRMGLVELDPYAACPELDEDEIDSLIGGPTKASRKEEEELTNLRKENAILKANLGQHAETLKLRDKALADAQIEITSLTERVNNLTKASEGSDPVDPDPAIKI